ncbi:ABC transporter substrate-binding protein [Thalassomonas viridans]|uniref:ABC transporter substrate-binding protein n=1 Tax=Thalassomonas viridans TaxID=137584 RepID=A0AAE9Z786_9GAMM|nr:c-type cytochrome [Thalassomonas viridans]WDE08051.1 ABC transporter substrate-binding protein [Thalassomonas viridans]
MVKVTAFVLIMLAPIGSKDANAWIVTTAKEKSVEMTAQQRRGQTIYMTGKSPSGQDIQARLNDKGASLPASLMPCVNCHQDDGKGTTEGGVSPPDIRWSSLTRPYGIHHQDGQTSPAYDTRSIKKAISMGVNSAGQSLNQIMPRYQLSHQDMDDLIAFLTGLGNYRISGVRNDSIRIGVILSEESSGKENIDGESPITKPSTRAKAITQVLNSYFHEINRRGGIYQREIETVFIPGPEDFSLQALAQFRQRLTDSQVFAFVASALGGIEHLMADFSLASGIPVIGAFSPKPAIEFPLNPNIFYLLSGQTRQLSALQSFTRGSYFRQHPDNRIPAKTYSPEKRQPGLKAAVLIEESAEYIPLKQQFNNQDQHIVMVPSTAKAKVLEKTLTGLKQQGYNQIYLLTSSFNQKAFISQAHAINWWPYVMLPGSQFGNALLNSPLKFNEKIFIALPNLPFDYKKGGLALFRLLHQKYGLSPDYQNHQLLALAAAILLREGLMTTGRELTPTRLIANMEALYQFDTALTRPISYGPNRRLGTSGAYVVTLDLVNKTIIPVSDWLEIE